MWLTEIITALLCFVSITAADPCFCPTNFDPVCASNGQVFNNACTLECHNVENEEELQVIGTGHCIEHLSTSPTSVNQQLEPCYNQCKNDYNPVVNTPNRKIYWNECYYHCDAKKEKHKSHHYLVLLGILSTIECIIIVVTKYIRKREHYFVFE